ncbi:MAG: glycosyltransferase [Bacteroidota bacterium]
MISIILPTYNSRSFLLERLDTIVNQTFEDWECIVIDGESKDGTWEYLQNIGNENPKFHLYQSFPRGPYDAWNRGIKKAKGKYIYIATADDTMKYDCLERLWTALEENKDCGIAHCNLTLIDDKGESTEDQWSNWGMARFLDKNLHKSHIRKSPYDAVLYMAYKTAYTSITQLLVKKSVYDNFGYFRTDFGNIADFEWGLRTTQCTNTIHVPYYLATWRQHADQLSDSAHFRTGSYYDCLLNMVFACNKTLRKIKVESICYLNADLYLPYLKEVLARGTMTQRFRWFFRKPILSTKILYQYLLKTSSTSSIFLKAQINKMQLNKNLLNI